jgi:hypothetical protein
MRTHHDTPGVLRCDREGGVLPGIRELLPCRNVLRFIDADFARNGIDGALIVAAQHHHFGW